MAPESRRWPRRARLTRSAELERVRLQGKRVRTRHVEVRWLASLSAGGRVGVIVPRYKHTAVARNLVKRRLRELSRLTLLPAMTGWPCALDVVLRAVPSAYDAPFEALQRDVAQACAALATAATAVASAPPAPGDAPPSSPTA